jgi:hypothetical protein
MNQFLDVSHVPGGYNGNTKLSSTVRNSSDSTDIPAYQRNLGYALILIGCSYSSMQSNSL